MALTDGSQGKCYGAILTCMVTRMVHLDIASDLSTVAFLRLLRRFFGRRGVPRTITSDNAPTFTMGEAILKDCVQALRQNPGLSRELSNREIDWRHITPYAPWQGGVYERLIQSVKHSLYKTVGQAVLSFDELSTVLVEIEALLNTRPLLYVDSDSVNESILRPIDFQQSQLEINYPFDFNPELEQDPTYLPSKEQVFLRTKTQAVQALQSSCQFTEKFWNIWQTQYLTSLREKHQIEIDKKRRSNRVPKQGDVVLISEPIQPRHCWKMGRVDEVIFDSNGEIREATVILPSKGKIRRPVNLLIPFEIEDEPTEDANLAEKQALEDQNKPNKPDAKMSNSTYDLRPRKKINYNEETRTIQHVRWTPLFISTLLSMAFLCGFSQAYETFGSNTSSGRHSLRCMQGGVELITLDQVPFEICAEDSCQTYLTPQVREIVKFPPQVVLHEHSVHWKFTDNHSIGTLETICPPAPFCEYIDCTVCSALIFNPECWPVGAILAFAIVAYFVLTGCYVFLYVPLVIGQPIRWSARLLCQVTRVLWNLYRNLRPRTRRRQNRRRSIDLVQLLAIIVLTGVANPPTSGCQLVNVFSHSSTICTEYKMGQVCKIQLSEILKINPFEREACFKLTRNQTTIHEIRASWKNLILTCEKETDYFTRDTDHNVIDSKRCPHMGSCVSNKCAAVNSSSIIPELDIGNKYPGNTYCVESCGGPGCDCFYWGSGCLFYRIYLTPRTTQVFEVYHCNRWQETVAIEFTHFDAVKGKTKTFLAHMLPNVPIKWKSFTFTLTSITVPPMPLLHTSFISDGNNTALWKAELKPSLRCNNETAATKLRCEVIEDCTCYPAETQANCKCRDLSISNWFNDLRHRLPVVLPAVTFRENKQNVVQASIQYMLTAEIILTLQENLSTNLVIDNDICTIDNAILVGCYNCAGGAQARVKCASSKFTKAEVLCDTASFTIPCDHGGIESVLQFSFAKAQVQVKCSVSCGEVVSEFEIGGILKFTDTIHGSMIKWLEGRTNSLTELQLPDLWHIANVFLQWYKTLIATLVTLLFIVGLTYVFLSSCGIRILTVFLKLCLNAGDIDGETTFLQAFIQVSNPTAFSLETQLQAVLNAIHRQVKVGVTDRVQWTHMVGDATFLQAGPGEQILLKNRCLRTAMVTKERISRLGTWYILMDRIYETQVEAGKIPAERRQEWLRDGARQEHDARATSVLNLVKSQLSFVKTSIRNMQDHLTKCERKFYEAECRSRDQVLMKQLKEEWNTVEEKLTTQVLELQDKRHEREKRIEQLEAKVSELEQVAVEDPSVPDERGSEERVVSDRESSRGSRHSVEDRRVQDVEDAEYWERMMDEIKEDRSADSPEGPFRISKLIPISPAASDERPEPPPPPKSPKMDRSPISRWRGMNTEMLEREVAEMERCFQVFPFRKLGDSSRGLQGDIVCAFCEAEGQHYSDSCAQVVNGDQRLEIINIRGWCKYCLEDCPVNRQCKFARKQCWCCLVAHRGPRLRASGLKFQVQVSSIVELLQPNFKLRHD
ncbi:hypothetical protein Y032_0001g239 [Ancylostoma ceylanicum]|nr:hypothetical protein Y032_0001g239 [Ancylostoma ceylanicum]